ncbi:MAG: hypothetical protein KKG99_14470 [Bacteroidetes bacterium]|nr:hypothetical protein [Bacteroidota bacterium]
MKKQIFSLIALLAISQFNFAQNFKTQLVKDKSERDATDRTNNFYDNEDTYLLPHSMKLEISGEIANPGIIDISKLPLHSVIVKEALPKGNTTEFIGSYRYDGVSLYDILNEYILAKKNAKEFRPIIDLYVEVENDKGEKVCISWGELYYPVHLHEIIIATKVMHIVPSKTKEYWTLPTESKLIIASDLLTCRNILNPTKITIKSLDKNFVVNQGMENMWSEELKVTKNGKVMDVYNQLPTELPDLTYPNIFYGRGKGIHGVTPFVGSELKSFLNKYIQLNEKNIRTGMVTISGLDGYRAAYTVSEIINRNDQSEILILDKNNYEGAGRFSIYPACDFFSDRAIKSVSEIHIDLQQ